VVLLVTTGSLQDLSRILNILSVSVRRQTLERADTVLPTGPNSSITGATMATFRILPRSSLHPATSVLLGTMICVFQSLTLCAPYPSFFRSGGFCLPWLSQHPGIRDGPRNLRTLGHQLSLHNHQLYQYSVEAKHRPTPRAPARASEDHVREISNRNRSNESLSRTAKSSRMVKEDWREVLDHSL